MPDGSPWRNRIVGSEAEVDPEQLLAHPDNWRRHDGAQRDALRGSLGVVGWVQQVIVNVTTSHVVDGHARIEEAISAGEKVPVLYVELTEEEERLVLATLDPIGAMAGRDDEKLAELLGSLVVQDAALAALIADLRPPFEPAIGATDPDEVPALADASNVKPGDLFALGEHRLLCGDSRSAEGVLRPLTGPVDLLLMDPPYGVGIGKKNRALDAIDRADRRTEDLSGDDSQGAATDLWKAAFPVIATTLGQGVPWYCFGPQGGDLGFLLLLLLLQESGLKPRHILIWRKNRPSFSIGRLDYDYAHEPIVYGWIEGARHRWHATEPQSSVLEYDRPQASPLHAMVKPVALVERLIRNSTAEGDLVFDPFMGSGTTIIAAEQSGRRAAGIEIEPRYVQVAIERWERFTGRKAERIEGAPGGDRRAPGSEG